VSRVVDLGGWSRGHEVNDPYTVVVYLFSDDRPYRSRMKVRVSARKEAWEALILGWTDETCRKMAEGEDRQRASEGGCVVGAAVESSAMGKEVVMAGRSPRGRMTDHPG
jgi:hypothetical protein